MWNSGILQKNRHKLGIIPFRRDTVRYKDHNNQVCFYFDEGGELCNLYQFLSPPPKNALDVWRGARIKSWSVFKR